MKELDDFTVERLQRIIRNAEGVTSPTHFEVTPADMEALARIALAAKTVQPLRVEIQMDDEDLMRRFNEMTQLRHPADPMVMPVFEANSPALPDGWMLVPNDPTTKQWAAGHRAMEEGIDKVTLAYRAMLAAAPPPPTTEK